MVKCLCQQNYDLEEWQSTFSIGEARDGAIAVLEANTVSLPR